MKAITRFLILILIITGTASFASSKNPERKFYEEYSITPPQGNGWKVMQNQDPVVVYMRKGKSKTHSQSMGVLAVMINPQWKDGEGYLKFLIDSKHADTDPKRFKILDEKYELTPKPAPLCVKYHMVVEDHNAINKGGADFLILSAHGLGCMHPSFTNHYYDIQYTERNMPEEADPNFEENGQAFLQGFEFIVADNPSK
jgi:hypothetical protein